MRLHPYAKGAVWFAETFLWFSTTAVDLAASPEGGIKVSVVVVYALDQTGGAPYWLSSQY